MFFLLLFFVRVCFCFVFVFCSCFFFTSLCHINWKLIWKSPTFFTIMTYLIQIESKQDKPTHDDAMFVYKDLDNTPQSTCLIPSLCTPRGCQIWHTNWVRLAPNGKNLGLFKISFSTSWLGKPKFTETDLKKSQICPILANLTQIGYEIWHSWYMLALIAALSHTSCAHRDPLYRPIWPV